MGWLQTPTWNGPNGVGEFRYLGNTYDDAMPAAASMIEKLSVHTGTHVDAPSHFSKPHFDKGLGIESLDLGVLNGAHDHCSNFIKYEQQQTKPSEVQRFRRAELVAH